MNTQKNIFKIFLSLILFLSWFSFGFAQEKTIKLRFNEIMYDPGGDDTEKEWVELFNYGETEITLIGGRTKEAWIFVDNTGSHFLAEKPLLGSLTIKPGDFLILASNAENFLKTHPHFSGTVIDTVMNLDNSYGFIQLKTGEGELVDQAFWSNNLGAAGNNKTLEYVQGIFREGLREGGSPGQENSVENVILPPAPSPSFPPSPSPSPSPQPKPSPKPTWLPSPEPKIKLVINEIFTNPEKNSPQWLELKNQGDQEVNLNQWKIVIHSRNQEIFLNQTIKANGYLVIEPIQVDRNQDTLQLVNPEGKKVFEVKYTSPLPLNWSAIRFDNGLWKITAQPTPGEENRYVLPQAVAQELVPQELIPTLAFETPLQPQTKEIKPKLSLKQLIVLGLGLSLILSGTFVLLKRKLSL